MNIDVKILNNVLASQIEQHTNRIIHCEKMQFIPGIQGWFNIHKLINVIHHTDRMQD